MNTREWCFLVCNKKCWRSLTQRNKSNPLIFECLMDDYLIWTHLWSYRILKWFLGGGLLITSFHLIKTFLRVYFKETKRRKQKRHKAVGTTCHGYGTLAVHSFAGSMLSWNTCLKAERAWGRLLSRSYVTALGNCKGTKGRRWIFRILSFLLYFNQEASLISVLYAWLPDKVLCD